MTIIRYVAINVAEHVINVFHSTQIPREEICVTTVLCKLGFSRQILQTIPVDLYAFLDVSLHIYKSVRPYVGLSVRNAKVLNATFRVLRDFTGFLSVSSSLFFYIILYSKGMNILGLFTESRTLIWK